MNRVERRRRTCTPLYLKRILKLYRISQTELAGQIIQRRGRRAGLPLGTAALNLVINHGDWPSDTPCSLLRRQTEVYLRARGVPDNVIEQAWEPDTGETPQRPKAPRKSRPQSASQGAHDFINPLPETEMLTDTAKRHFKLFRDPFVDDVQEPADVFLSAEQRYIRDAMFNTAKLGGFLAVIGESGAGKTTLRRDLIDRISREGHPITVIQPRVIDKGRLTAGTICDAIVGDISQEHCRASLEAKARQIERLLTGSSRAGNSHVLIIEEAHDLNVSTLKYLKRFWELEDGFKKLLAILLIGQPELSAKLDERQNWAAREVIRRCEIAELQPLNGDLEGYLTLKLKRIGSTLDDVLDTGACDAIRARLTLRRRGTDATVSMHYPLVVNNLLVKCLNLAADLGVPKINAEIVEGV